MSRIRVLIADDHQVVREGLGHVIAQAPDMRVAALAADGNEALSAALEHEPHVAVVDMRMPGLGGIAAITQLRERCPRTKLLVLSMYEDDRYVRAAVKAGAHGYVSKRSGTATLLRAIRSVHAGERFLDSAESSSGGAQSPVDEDPALSIREREVMRSLVLGQPSRVVAESLGISKSSVDTYRARIFRKWGVENRAELLARLATTGDAALPPDEG
jgi:two-component system, NarL family, response regulator NreC